MSTFFSIVGLQIIMLMLSIRLVQVDHLLLYHWQIINSILLMLQIKLAIDRHSQLPILTNINLYLLN
jgi:hypothetical protein